MKKNIDYKEIVENGFLLFVFIRAYKDNFLSDYRVFTIAYENKLHWRYAILIILSHISHPKQKMI